MTIRLKILIGCFGLTLIATLIGIHERATEHQLGALSVKLYDDAFQAMSYLRSAQNDLLVAATRPQEDPSPRLNDAIDNLAVAEARALSPAGRQASAALHDLLPRLRNVPPPGHPDFDAAERQFDTAVEIYAADGYHLRRAVGDVLVETDRTISILIGLSLMAAILMMTLLSRSILPQVRAAVAIAQSIAAGRLDNRIEPRGHSETAMLLRALAAMQTAIADAMAENRRLLEQQRAEQAATAQMQTEIDSVVQLFGSGMAGVFRIVSGASVGMGGIADGLLADADALLRCQAHVREQVEQVVARIEGANQSSRALSTAIFGIRTETAQTEQRARSTLEETRAASERMESLGRAADEITSVADMIGAIAAQTKLLALNASIEAARAGPAGSGFAVVANEVKRLADRSAAAAQTVGARIASILDAAGSTRVCIDAIDRSARDVHRLSASIAQAVAHQDVASAAILASMSDIQANALNVLQSLTTIVALTRDGAGNLRGIVGQTTHLSGNAADLSREVAAFLEFVRAIKPGSIALPIPVQLTGRLVLDGVSHSGRAVFTSELALSFQPSVAADIGATGVLYLDAVDHSLPVRVAQIAPDAVALQPPLTDVERSRLRAVLDRAVGHGKNAASMTCDPVHSHRAGSRASPVSCAAHANAA